MFAPLHSSLRRAAEGRAVPARCRIEHGLPGDALDPIASSDQMVAHGTLFLGAMQLDVDGGPDAREHRCGPAKDGGGAALDSHLEEGLRRNAGADEMVELGGSNV